MGRAIRTDWDRHHARPAETSEVESPFSAGSHVSHASVTPVGAHLLSSLFGPIPVGKTA
jgi:hypothetical protein